uniref:Uncharacterized protein n=1 Tax=Molossus molossus TaxID=27622 RepID=A0A7J8CZU8_MOLMO|nr:hypothetical protein HJG59_009527 [Molossus molossus]
MACPPLFQRRGSDPTSGGKASLSKPPTWPLVLRLAQMTGPRYFLSPSLRPRSPGFTIWHQWKQQAWGYSPSTYMFPELRSVPGVHRTETSRNWPPRSSEKAPSPASSQTLTPHLFPARPGARCFMNMSDRSRWTKCFLNAGHTLCLDDTQDRCTGLDSTGQK